MEIWHAQAKQPCQAKHQWEAKWMWGCGAFYALKSFKIMGRICPKANSTVCSKFQMVPINSIAKLVLEIISHTPCCTSQWLLCSEALVVLAMSSIDYSWRKRRVLCTLQNQRRSRNSQMPTTPSAHPIPSWHQPHRVYHQTMPRLWDYPRGSH